MIVGVDLVLLDQAPPLAAMGSIAGVITYSGRITTTHNIVVFAVLQEAERLPTDATVIAGVGPYTITDVADGTHVVAAFMDLRGDMGPPQPDEPFGWYDLAGDGPDPVTVCGSAAVTGVNI